jgi:hypothetical protein
MLTLGLALALSVYYLNYDGSFVEDAITAGSPLTLPLRLLAVTVIVAALAPYKIRPGSAALLTVMYLCVTPGFFLVAGLHGQLNDGFFVNTLLQVPVLMALAYTSRQLDIPRVMRLFCIILVLQVLVDTAIWYAGASLWMSDAFVGGVGNPSSFGLLCSIGVAFALFHPQAARSRWWVVFALTVGAVMSKALFAVLAVTLVIAIWLAGSWRRVLAAVPVVLIAVLAFLTLLAGTGQDDETGFLEHKLSAAGALIGLVEYDVESSATVYQRIEMHERTFEALRHDLLGVLVGHLEGLPYWPMDSQVLTYLGSFGAPMLLVFLGLHLWWMTRAWATRRLDGGFALVVLGLFGLIFTTNRILDYFPMATVYFLVVASVLRRGFTTPVAQVRRTSRPGSTRWSSRGPRRAAPSAPIPASRAPA